MRREGSWGEVTLHTNIHGIVEQGYCRERYMEEQGGDSSPSDTTEDDHASPVVPRGPEPQPRAMSRFMSLSMLISVSGSLLGILSG